MRADVVVVGAGAAGCVMAARLSERAQRSVLLLEAGPETVSSWPGATAMRTPQQHATPYTRGFGVGGSASLNAMVANVGEHDDYDEWERAYGCGGWSWRDVRPWFRRVALPQRRARRSELGPLAGAILRSAEGAERARLTRKADGRRASVREVYLEPARQRRNLQVRSNTLVNRVLFEDRRAVGVLLADGGVVDAATVVVCAGALQSPAILLRSGVDREGVGHGLHDHPSLSIPVNAHPTEEVLLAVSVVVWATHLARHDVQLVPFDSPQGASLLGAAMRVHSRGRVRLSAVDPAAHPIVEFNMLADERDLELLRVGARRVAALATATDVPLTDDALRAAVGEYVHAAGSCRMGPASDSMAVVDGRCRVIGYESLFVCDASVMPNLPRANPCLPTVMIAERVAGWLAGE